MAILKNVELFYPRLDPKKPNARFNKEQPTWEVQIRTRDKKVKNEWAALNLKPKTVEDDDGKVFYSVTLRKKSKKKDGEVNQPVKVIDGGLNDINPMSIGNGSIGNVRIFQYEYGDEKKIASMLMAVQITKLNEYIPKPSDDEFEMTETEIVRVADADGGDDDEDDNPY
jgi:hypothetical protein